MTRLGGLILGGAALVLLTTVAFEETAPYDDGAPHATVLGADAAALTRPQATTPAERVDETDGQVALILARPLFSRDRRPDDAAVAVAAAVAELPRLTGIVIGPYGRQAFFAPGPGGKPTVVAEGGTLGSYRIVSITAAGVRVEGPGQPRTLMPAFGPPATAEPDATPVPQAAFQPGRPPVLMPGRRPAFPGQDLPGQDGSSESFPGQIMPGQAIPGQLMPMPGQFPGQSPGQPSDRGDPTGAAPQVDGGLPSPSERTLAAADAARTGQE